MSGPAVIRLDDPGDDRVAAYRHLTDAGRRQAVEAAEGIFVVEGARPIERLLEQAWPVRSVLLSEAQERARPDLVSSAGERGIPVYVGPQAVVDSLAGFHVHRGALALAERPPPSGPVDVLDGCRLALVVEGVNDHENLGSLFRNAAAFGIGAVLLDPRTCDPLYRRSVRVSMGHVLAVPFARVEPWPGGLEELRRRGWTIVALTPAGADLLAATPAPAGPLAVLVGAEGDGLSPAALAAADHRVRIPMAAGVDSLNVATAAAVAFHHFTSSARGGPTGWPSARA